MKNSLLEYIAFHAQKSPNKHCIMEEDRVLTYADFWRMIYGFSKYLVSKGLKRGECAVVVADQKSSFLISLFAIQMAGGICVPLDNGVGGKRLESLIDLTASHILISDEHYDIDCVQIAMSLAWEFDKDVDFIAYPNGSEISEIIFTSGTTGIPKGIVMSFGGSLSAAENVVDGLEMKTNNIEVIPVPLSHTYGLKRCYANLLNGSSIVLYKRTMFINEIYDIMEKYSATSLSIVPSVLSLILRFGSERLITFSSKVDYIQFSGANLDENAKKSLCELLPESRLYNFYGSTEAGCACTYDFNKYKGLVSCVGRPSKNAKFKFIDENWNEFDAKKDNPGILAVSGSMCMKGYYKNPELTAKIMKDGYYYTNDLAYRGNDGYIYVIGRNDDIINNGGMKISPSEIEAVVSLIEGVNDCACVPIDDKNAGQAPKLFVVMNDGRPFIQKDIRNSLKPYLEPFKIPKIIVEIDKIPRTSTGKVQRNLLKY